MKDSPLPHSESVSQRMRNTRQRDTPMELEVRAELKNKGFQFEVDFSIKGVTRARPDIVFCADRVAIFLDGCFWHSCPTHGTTPRTNRQWWTEKLASNVERDRRHVRELNAAGWQVLRYWEHEDPATVANDVATILNAKNRSS